MSKLIRQLLGEKDPRFALGLARLESAAANPGIDARLTAEILSTTKQKMAGLGLDPSDTTGAELYAALCSKLMLSEEHLVAYLGHPANIDAGSDSLLKLINSVIGKRETWAVKHAVLRKLLKDHPPKKVMKAFHYHSSESMARRMDPAEIMMAARILESKTWWLKTRKLLESLTNKDFEKTKLRIISLNDAKWIALLSDANVGRGHQVVHVKEAAMVGFLVSPGGASYLTALVACLHAVNEVLLHGSFLKLHFVNPSIGNMLVHAIDEGTMLHASVGGVSFHWRDIQRYHGLRVAEGERVFSHLDVHDLGWIAVETKISLLIPEFAFWVGTDFCGVVYGEDKVISCNVLDIAESVAMQLPFSTMKRRALQRALKGELLARYLEQPAARAVVLKQFDISAINEENW